jgi:hypothetical protein
LPLAALRADAGSQRLRKCRFLDGSVQGRILMMRIFRHYVSVVPVLFMLLELLLFFAANVVIVITSYLYGFPSGLKGFDPYLFSAFLSMVQVSIMWSVGLYRLESMTSRRTIVIRTFVVLSLSLPLFVVLYLLVSRSVRITASYAPIVEMALSLLVSWTIATILRMIMMVLVQRVQFRRRLLVVGAGQRASSAVST